jgi:hypothetical protein
MGDAQPIEIETKEQLEGMHIGCLVKRGNRVGVYAGIEWLQTPCSLCCDTHPFPIIVYPSGKKEICRIDREAVYSLNKPTMPHQINGLSVVDSVRPGDEKYDFYKGLFGSNLLSD